MKNSLKRIIVTFISVVFFSTAMLSQSETQSDNNFNVTSSGSSVSASFVDYYTGKINTSIPIFEYVGAEFNFPLAINYTSTGIRVDQLAESVGLGWDLAAGGRMYRKINENRDPSPSDVALSPDLYEANAPGLNEYFEQQTPYNPCKSVRNPSIHANYRISFAGDWIITSSVDGTKYYFGENNATESSTVTSTGGAPPTTDIDSWMLTKIESANNLDVYTFTYEKYDQSSYINVYGNARRISGMGLQNMSSSFKTTKQMLKAVFHNNEKIISFNYGARNDLVYNTSTGSGNALTEILFYGYKSDIAYKKATFTYSYFGNLSLPVSSSDHNLHRRLKLDEVTMYGWNQNAWIEGDKYKFDYKDPASVPSVGSFARDYLGLYNGKNSNVLIDLYNYYQYENRITQRDYDFSKSLAGTLYKITFPSKGYVEYTYERNTFSGPTDFIDGFRIKAVSNYSSASVLVNKKEYVYTSPHKFDFSISFGNYPWGYTTPVPLFYDTVKEYAYGTGSTSLGMTEYIYYSYDTQGHHYTVDPFDFHYPYYGFLPASFAKTPIYGPGTTNEKLKEKNVYDSQNRRLQNIKYEYGAIEYPSSWYRRLLGSEGPINEVLPITRDFWLLKDEFITDYPVTGLERYSSRNYNYELIGDVFLTISLSGIHSSFGTNTSYSEFEKHTTYGPLPARVFNYSGSQLMTAHRYYSLLKPIAAVSTKENNLPEIAIEYDSNNLRAQTIQYTSGTIVSSISESLIYAYDDQLIVARLKGIKYGDIPPALISAIKTASNNAITPANVTAMETALAALRNSTDANMLKAQITTFTYNPVFGVTSVTDPKGYTIYTEYDAFGRQTLTKELSATERESFNILTENKYNTRSN